MAQKLGWSIKELTETLNQTALTDKDNMIPFDGATGSGKSTLAMKMCIKGCPWFNMERDVVYSRKELMNWITTARPGSWALADEAVNMLFKRDFATRDQKFLLRVLDMCRDKNLTICLCIPNFWALDKHILDGRVRLRIHIARTGMAFMWKPDPNPFAQDKWYRRYNEKVCYNWAEHYNARKTKGFVGYLMFGDLAEIHKEKYLRIKKEKKEKVQKEQEEAEATEIAQKKKSVEFGKTILLSFLSSHGLLKKGALARMADMEGVTQGSITHRLQRFKEKYNPDSSETLLDNSPINIAYSNN